MRCRPHLKHLFRAVPGCSRASTPAKEYLCDGELYCLGLSQQLARDQPNFSWVTKATSAALKRQHASFCRAAYPAVAPSWEPCVWPMVDNSSTGNCWTLMWQCGNINVRLTAHNACFWESSAAFKNAGDSKRIDKGVDVSFKRARGFMIMIHGGPGHGQRFKN